MSVFKCKMCGGTIEFEQGATVGVCEYCGTKQTLPKTSDDVIANLFNRANNLRLKCEFDKAEQIYEKIVQQDDSEAEAHWGIVLCKYGIEYVEDPKTMKRIPTCHRTLFDAVTADPDYLAAVDYSDASQQSLYESEARTIDRIQKDILAIVKNEKPFDVFICYKETDENGKRTLDSAIANDIYYQLTQEGFKVFYAAITLEDKLGQEYEPYIFAALNSAKVMLVIGTKPEYYNAVWVKNEWSRFLKLMKTDRSKLLIPCYRDMDAYDLPEEFAHLQAQDMGKIGFINDVVRGIKKVIKSGDAKPEVKETVAAAANTNTAPLLKRAFIFLEDGSWQEADEYCEKVLDQDPENGEAYLGKLMAELNVRKRESLADVQQPFDNSSNYQKAVRFGDEKLRSELTGYIDHINERNENTRLTGIYNDAVNTLNSARTAQEFINAANAFKSIREFKNAYELAKICIEKAEAFRKDAVYASAMSQMTGTAVSGYESAIKTFSTIAGWKDADEKIIVCQRIIRQIKEKKEADRLERERQAKQKRIAAEKAAKKLKRIAIILTAVIIASITFVILLFTVIIPSAKYNAAVDLYNAGKYDEAITAFKELNGYKDSTQKANDIFSQYKMAKLKAASVGDVVYFGSYEQDNNTSNGKEYIEWIVLAKEGNKALVISKYALDCQQYNTSYTDVTWETCSLRKWLNGTFLSAAFNSEEQNSIISSTVTADKNPSYSTSPGNNTTDKVFLLSITEVNKYCSSDSACSATAYAKAQGAYTNTSNGNCWWWLRSPGDVSDFAALVYDVGSVHYYGYSVSSVDGAVRPALWINLED